jgi:Domain of unknown function (DUF4169)
MTEIINLNKARKTKVRTLAKLRAVRNRFAFGVTKAQKTTADSNLIKAGSALDGHKRGS